MLLVILWVAGPILWCVLFMCQFLQLWYMPADLFLGMQRGRWCLNRVLSSGLWASLGCSLPVLLCSVDPIFVAPCLPNHNGLGNIPMLFSVLPDRSPFLTLFGIPLQIVCWGVNGKSNPRWASMVLLAPCKESNTLSCVLSVHCLRSLQFLWTCIIFASGRSIPTLASGVPVCNLLVII